MAARKSTTKKASPAKKAAAKKAPAKASAKKAPAKKAAAKKAASKKPAAKKTAKPAPRKAARPAAKKAARPATKKAAEPKSPESKPAKAATKGVSSTQVNMGIVFTLRPRVSKTFRQEDFLSAKRLLEDESYANIQEAARAVVEKALSLSNDPKSRPGANRGR